MGGSEPAGNWNFPVNFSVEKCFSVSFALVKWNITTVVFPPKKSSRRQCPNLWQQDVQVRLTGSALVYYNNSCFLKFVGKWNLTCFRLACNSASAAVCSWLQHGQTHLWSQTCTSTCTLLPSARTDPGSCKGLKSKDPLRLSTSPRWWSRSGTRTWRFKKNMFDVRARRQNRSSSSASLFFSRFLACNTPSLKLNAIYCFLQRVKQNNLVN